jgi:hypothetical protein
MGINQNFTDMDTILIAILLIFFLTGLFFTWFFIHKARAKERLLLLEKGIDLSNLPQIGKFKFDFPWLKIGIITTSISIGAFLGIFLLSIPGVVKLIPQNFIYPGDIIYGMLLLFGGIGMILANFLDKPKEQN